MIWNHYDDFDAWGEAVQTADLRLVCDAVERRSWRLKAGGIGDVFLQMADEGGGNLCHGANTHGHPAVRTAVARRRPHLQLRAARRRLAAGDSPRR